MSTETIIHFAKRTVRGGAEWCVQDHGYQAINPTPPRALI